MPPLAALDRDASLDNTEPRWRAAQQDSVNAAHLKRRGGGTVVFNRPR
jgi:hypothetical protein